MVCCAIFYGFVELVFDFIPIIGQSLAFVVDLFAITHFAFWFLLCGVGLFNIKKVSRFWLPAFINLLPIPLIDVFILTLSVALTVSITWKEDGLIKKPKTEFYKGGARGIKS